MTAPAVLFLPPRFETEEERTHRDRVSRLSDSALHVYATRIRLCEEKGLLRDLWRKTHVQEEQRRRS